MDQLSCKSPAETKAFSGLYRWAGQYDPLDLLLLRAATAMAMAK